MTKPLVSIVMPVFNALPYLPQCVDSMLTQTYLDFEFLIYDDESSDGSLEYLRSLDDSRIRLICNDHQGYAPLLNRGIREARGELIARMDADDVALPDRLEKQVALMKDDLECVACGSSVVLIDENERVLDPCHLRPATHQEGLLMLALGRTHIFHPSAMYRTEAARSIGGYTERLVPAEDYDFWWRLAKKGQLKNVQQPLVKYRKHSGSISALKHATQKAHARIGLLAGLQLHTLAHNDDEAEGYAAVLYGEEKSRLDTEQNVAGYVQVWKRLLDALATEPVAAALLHSAYRTFRWRLKTYLERKQTPRGLATYLAHLTQAVPGNASPSGFLWSHLMFSLRKTPGLARRSPSGLLN